MFKLAVFTDEVSQDFDRAVDFAKKFRLDGIEIRSVWNTPPQEQGPDVRKKMDEVLEGTDLEVASIASPFFKCDLGDKGQYTKHLEILRRSIDLGHHFKCCIIRGFTFWKLPDVEAHWQEILDNFAEPVKILEAGDAVLGIENESSTNHGTGALVRRFIDDLGSPRVKSIWDPANSFHAGADPFPADYEAVAAAGDIVHVHVKDAKRDPKTGKVINCEVGDGGCRWADQLQRLKDDGYEGYCSLETHWRLDHDLDAETQKLPGGEKYTAGAEAASAICMRNIKDMVAALT
jgi:sugar phosphate isomerase/epimerase